MTFNLKKRPFSGERRKLVQLAASVPLLWVAGRIGIAEGAASTEHASKASSASAAEGGAVARARAKTLTLINTHTSETLSASYFAAGHYQKEALGGLNTLLRDHRTGDVGEIDPQLFDLLHSLASQADCEPRFEVISGYRSPTSNSYLRSHSSGVARNSLHMQGKAIDVRLCGVNCSRLRDIALELQGGGVGFYRKSDFVHIDTGRVRFWTG